MSDAALRRAELGAPGTETHAATLARAGRWREAEALYRRLRDEARERQWALGIALEDLPISETRGPTLSPRALEARAAYLAAIREVRHLSRARAACESARRSVGETPEERVIDMSFDDATDVTSIRYRLAPIDVGFDLRAEGVEVVIDAAEYPLRVSYADDEGERRVLEGSRREVVDRLRALGYVVRSDWVQA